MKDVLFDVGTIVKVEIEESITMVLITGKRQVKQSKINYNDEYTYTAWDYIGIHFPNGVDEGVCHFNHLDIVEIVHHPPDGLYR